MSSTAPLISAIVPTVGLSPWLVPCLEALRKDGSDRLEIALVDQGSDPAKVPESLVDIHLRQDRNLGFAAANNLGAKATQGPFLATVNDDVVVRAGWCQALLDLLQEQPEAAAAQGVNLKMEPSEAVDGWGFGWNPSWQAVQAGHGHQPPPRDAPPRQVFGTSATATLYRRSAIEAAGRQGPDMFDERLGSYYEDVELACRLRQAGFTAWAVPAARAWHAGSTSGQRLGGTARWIYGNRYLVLAGLLGRGFWGEVPRLLWRDVRDLAKAIGNAEGRLAAGILRGWSRALGRLPAFAHRGRPSTAYEEALRLPPVDSWPG